MNQPEVQTQETQTLSAREKLRLYNRDYMAVWAKKQYHNNEEYQEKQLSKNSQYVKSRYASDPEYRQGMLENSSARYHRLKAQVSH